MPKTRFFTHAQKGCAFLIALFFGQLLWAQNPCKYKINGSISRSDDLVKVAGVEIFIEKGHYRTFSNETGDFEIANLCAGLQILEFDAQGYKHQHMEVMVSADIQVNITLEPLPTELDSLMIRGHAQQGKWLNEGDISRHQGRDLARTLLEIPGVAVLQSGNSIAKPMLQGFTGLRLPIYVNGMRQEGQQWGPEHGPEIAAMGYESVSIVRGAATLEKTHDALGGYIAIDNKSYQHLGQQDLETGIGYNSNGHQFSAMSKFFGMPYGKRFSYFGNVSGRRGGNYSAPDYTLGNTGLAEISANTGIFWGSPDGKIKRNLNASFFNNRSGIFSGSKTGNISDLNAAIQRGRPLHNSSFSYSIGVPLQSVLHAALNFSHERIGLKNRSLKKMRNLKAFGLQYDNRREYDFHRSSSVNYPQLDLYLLHGYFNSQYEFNFLRNLLNRVGYSMDLYYQKYGGNYFIPNFFGLKFGLYTGRSGKWSTWEYDFRVRLDNASYDADWHAKGADRKDSAAFANYSAAFTLKKGQKIQIDLMRLWRAPWLNEMYSFGVHAGSAAFEQGNANLGMERDYKIGIQYKEKYRRANFYFNTYGNYMPGFINLSPDSALLLTVRGAFPSYTYKQFTALYTGAEMRLDLDLGKGFKSRSQAAFTYARDLDHGAFPAFVPPPYFNQAFLFETGKALFMVSSNYTFRQKFYTAGTDLIPPPAGYWLWNFRLELKNLFKKQNYIFYLEVENIFNARYRNYLDRFRYFSDMPGRNISIKFIQNLHHHYEK